MSPIVPIELDVSELFFSIQGESTFAGLPCIFIRLAGCNLRCNYCDARYTYEEKSKRYRLQELINFVRKYPHAIVEVTGGEPLLQENTYALLSRLLELQRPVLLETNGSIDISRVPKDVIKIMDIKCPDSGMSDKMLFENISKLTPDDQVKFVISSKNDYTWAKETLKKYTFPLHILFSVMTEKLVPADLSQWIIDDQLNVRLQLQLHKFIWPEFSRGV